MASAHSRRLLTLSIAFAMLLSLAVAVVLVRTHRTLMRVAQETADAHHLAYTFGPLATIQNRGFEAITAPAYFASAAALDGHIFLAGQSALQMYSAAGMLERTFQVGVDLPPAALGKIVTARLRGQSEAHLFVATAGAGVLMFDPAHQSFAQLLPASAPLRDVTALACLPSGELLLGTRRNGLLAFDGKLLTLFRPEYEGAAVTSLLVNGSEVWVGTQDHGVLHTHAGVTDRLQSELPDPHVETLAGGGPRIFAATPMGVQMFEYGRPSRVLAPDTFAQALFAEEKTLTLSTLAEGTTSIVLDGGRSLRATRATASQPVEQFVTFGGSADVYAVRHDGLFRRAGERWLPVLEAAKSALADNNIAALNFSPDGRLWVGYFDHGLDLVDPASGSAQHMEDDHLFCINRIALDPRRQTMAVATANGLVLFDSAAKPRQVLTRRDGLISDHVTDVVFSPAASTHARMTLATPAGLTFVDDTGVASLYAFQGLVNNHVYALATSTTTDEILAGTLGGVSMLTQQSVRRNLTVANSGLRHNWITAALPMTISGRDAGYMVGTYGAGVMRLDSRGRFSPMDLATREMVINPNAMLATSSHVFAGSLNQGLWSYSLAAQHWTQVTAGLPSLNVTAFAARDGIVYIGTQNGLVRIAESKLPQ